jgi:hypothetical protein
VNQRDLDVMADMIDFKDVFRSKNMTDLDLVEGDVVWLVQSYSNSDEECQQYPSKFIRNPKGSKVMQYLQSEKARNRIFCLSHPKRSVEEGDLLDLDYVEFDGSYKRSIDNLRKFIGSVGLKRGILKDSPMTGGNLADLLEKVVPALNELRVPARALISLHADALSQNVSSWALGLFEAKSDIQMTRNSSCSRQPAVEDEFTQIRKNGLAWFDSNMKNLPSEAIDGLSRMRRDLEGKLRSHAKFSSEKIKSDWIGMCFPIKHVQVVWDCQMVLVFLFPIEAILRSLGFCALASGMLLHACSS